MTEYSVKVVRAVLKDLQRLAQQHSEDIAHTIHELSQGKLGNRRKLQGYRGLWRTRRNEIRVIWTPLRNNAVLVIKAGLRGQVYQDVGEDRNRRNPLNLSDVLKIQAAQTEDLPTYEVNLDPQSWDSFVYGDYLYYPVLTQTQKTVFEEFKDTALDFHQDRVTSLLLQSSPGTGKTVLAAFMASELHQYSFNVALILPKMLCEYVKEIANIKQILQQRSPRLFVGTLSEWFEKVDPTLYAGVASLSEELAAFRNAIRANQDFSLHDWYLYRSFINPGDQFAHDRDPIYQDNQARIEEIRRHLMPERLQRNLQNKKSWLDGLEELTDQLSPIGKGENGTVFIFDEAQDYLLHELQLIVKMLSRWKDDRYQTVICLLGDMNQRIYPVNFDWGHLELNRRSTLKYNYRNTEKILEFANIFHGFAKQINRGNRHLPEPSSPSDAFEKGEPVKLLECSSKAEAWDFLERLSQTIRHSTDRHERGRYLMRKLSERVTLIHQSIPEERQNLDGIEYVSIEKAKGREFEACIAFCVFEQQEEMPSFEEANNWYMIFTRPRYRLLAIATSDEITRIGREHFDKCDNFNISNGQSLLDWIAELSNAEDLIQNSNAISDLINRGLETKPIQIYWDTYTALQRARIDDGKIAEIEAKIVAALKNQDREILREELAQTKFIFSLIDRVQLRCLILRSLDRSWEAVDEAAQIAQDYPQQYHRLLNAIADELVTKKLIYEAARIRAKIGLPLPREYPFRDAINGQTGSLVSLLCQAAIAKISANNNLLPNQDLKK
jgi:mRNA-degrading endonuclease RelE of RelBE toxin-antitoxin system